MHYRCAASNRAIQNTAEATGGFIKLQTKLKRTLCRISQKLIHKQKSQ